MKFVGLAIFSTNFTSKLTYYQMKYGTRFSRTIFIRNGSILTPKSQSKEF